MTENTPADPNPTQASVTLPDTPAPTEAAPTSVLRKVEIEIGKVTDAIEAFAAEHGLDAALITALKERITSLL
jgi:hypothetical protein